MTHFSVCAAPGVCGRTGLLYNELSLVASLTTHGLTYGEKMRGGVGGGDSILSLCRLDRWGRG